MDENWQYGLTKGSGEIYKTVNAGSVTVSLTKEAFKNTEQPVLPKLWDIVEFFGRPAIVYRLNVSIDEDGRGHTLTVKPWKLYKQPWRNKLKLWWLKLRVKFNWI